MRNESQLRTVHVQRICKTICRTTGHRALATNDIGAINIAILVHILPGKPSGRVPIRFGKQQERLITTGKRTSRKRVRKIRTSCEHRIAHVKTPLLGSPLGEYDTRFITSAS